MTLISSRKKLFLQEKNYVFKDKGVFLSFQFLCERSEYFNSRQIFFWVKCLSCINCVKQFCFVHHNDWKLFFVGLIYFFSSLPM